MDSLSGLFSPESISYIANLCAILAFIVGAGFVTKISISRFSNKQKTSGDGMAAQGGDGPNNLAKDGGTNINIGTHYAGTTPVSSSPIDEIVNSRGASKKKGKGTTK